MTAMPRHRHAAPRRLALAALVALACLGSAPAQQRAASTPTAKGKLYCWDEGGHHVCSDTLPPSAVGRARTEFDTRTGSTVSQVGRQLTSEERQRAAAEEQARKAQEALARREMAMVMSYQTEDDLERSFRNRFELIEESLKGSSLALVNLHRSLISLLQQANEMELQSQPVGKRLREKIRTQHAELMALRALKQRQEAERTALDAEFKDAMSRYRALKAEREGTLPPAATPGG